MSTSLRTFALLILFLSSQVSYATDPVIRSAEQLQKYVQQNTNNPISRLSLTGREEFLDSLKFCNEQLSSFNYAVLRKELTPSQTQALLSLFGLELNSLQFAESPSFIAASDSGQGFLGSKSWIQDYACRANGACYYSPGQMCNAISCRPPAPTPDALPELLVVKD